MPVFNEEQRVANAVKQALDVEYRCEVELVVVDDGSRDGTAARLDALSLTTPDHTLRLVRHAANSGYGTALRSGFEAARGDLVFYTDSDNQFDLGQLREALPLMRDHDAVLGYRLDRQDPWSRRCASAFFNWLTCGALGIDVRDLNCSFKLFRRELIQSLRLVSADFFIDAEIVARIHRAGWRYTQLAVRHYPRRAGRSSVRASDVPRTLRSLVRMRSRLREEALARAPAPERLRL
jgi:dolichol-phosphate mannosyltransferase